MSELTSGVATILGMKAAQNTANSIGSPNALGEMLTSALGLSPPDATIRQSTGSVQKVAGMVQRAIATLAPPRSPAEISKEIERHIPANNIARTEDVIGVKHGMQLMLNDKRFATMLGGHKALVDQLRTSLYGADMQKTRSLLGSFATIFEGVHEAPDLFANYVQTGRLMARGAADVTDPLSQFATFGDVEQTVPHVSRGVKLDPQQQRRLDSWKLLLNNAGLSSDPFVNEDDIVSQTISVGQENRKVTLAGFRIGSETKYLPLDDADNYKFGTAGHVIPGDRSGSLLYGMPRVLGVRQRDPNAVFQSGFEYLYGLDNPNQPPAIIEALKKAHKEGVSLDKLLVKNPALDEGMGGFHLLELINSENNPAAKAAQKDAQVHVVDLGVTFDGKTPSALAPGEQFRVVQEKAIRAGIELKPMGSGAQISDGLAYWTQAEGALVDPEVPGGVPEWTKMILGEREVKNGVVGPLKKRISETRRPVRLQTNPRKLLRPMGRGMINPGSYYGLQQGVSLINMHSFSAGAESSMRRLGMDPFVTGTFYLSSRSSLKQSIFPGEGLIIDITGTKQGEAVKGAVHAGAPTLVEINLGVKNFETNETTPHMYNKKLTPVLESLRAEQERIISRGGVMSQEERRAFVSRHNIMLEDEEFVGLANTNTNVVPQIMKKGTGGRLTDVEILETGFRLTVQNDSPLVEGAKIEGSAIGLLSSPMLPPKAPGIGAATVIADDYRVEKKSLIGKLLTGQEEEVVPGGKRPTNEQRWAQGQLLGSEKSGYDQMDVIVEDRHMLRDGNIQALRNQQQTGLALFISNSESQLDDNLKRINAQVIKGDINAFRSVMKSGLLEDYADADTTMLMKTLIHAQKELPKENRALALSAIFGLENEADQKKGGLGRVLRSEEGRRAMKGLGLADEFLDDLDKGISGFGVDNSGMAHAAVGLGYFTKRDEIVMSTANEAKVERRVVDQLMDTLTPQHDPREAQFNELLLEQVISRTKKGDPLYRRSLIEFAQKNANLVSGKVDAPNVLDLTERTQDVVAQTEKIRKEGGVVRYAKGKQFFFPGEDLMNRLKIKESRGGAYVEDLDLHKILNSLLHQVAGTSFGVSEGQSLPNAQAAMEAVDRLALDLARVTREKLTELMNSSVEGRISGASSGKVLAPLLDEATKTKGPRMGEAGDHLPHSTYHGYTVGMSKDKVEEFFEKAAKGASKPEKQYLGDWKEQVMAGKATVPVADWQHPQVNEKSISMMAGYYDPTVKGNAYRIGVNVVNGNYVTKTGLYTGKLSSDLDGDIVTMMFFYAKKAWNAIKNVFSRPKTYEDAVKKWSTVRNDLQSPEFFAAQAKSQEAFYDKAKAYETSIKSNINEMAKLAGDTEVLEELSMAPSDINNPAQQQLLKAKRQFEVPGQAYVKGAGQADIGPISNALKDLSRVTSNMQKQGAISVADAEEMKAMLQGMEQFAVGFKHASVRIVNRLREQVLPILENVDEGVRSHHIKALTDFFREYGISQGAAKGSQAEANANNLGRILTKIGSPESEKAVTASIELSRHSASTIGASRRSEKITASDIVGANEEQVAGSHMAIRIGDSEAANAELAGAILVEEKGNVAATAARVEQMAESKSGQMLAAANKGIHEAAAAVTGEAPATVKAAESITRTWVENKSILSNKYARVAAIGGAAMAGIYALFNKGYDDEPLSDIPPPPPGRLNMGTPNATLEAIKNGSLLNDNLSRNDIMRAQASNGGSYAENQIGSGTSIMNKSYLDGASARISNRNVIIDRSNPVEYAKAIQASLPGAHVGLNINYNHKVPSNLDREF
jgi:hypothetical protein